MRSAMICVSVMLALFLGWPLAFGGSNAVRIETSRAEARPVLAVAEAAKPQMIPAVALSDATRPESCYKRFQREVRLCDGGAPCRLKANDRWDLCEATGFWPD